MRGRDLGKREAQRRCTQGISRKLQQIAVCLQSDVHAAANRFLFAGQRLRYSKSLFVCGTTFTRLRNEVYAAANRRLFIWQYRTASFLLQLRSEILVSASRNGPAPPISAEPARLAASRSPGGFQSGIIQPAFVRQSTLPTRPLACSTHYGRYQPTWATTRGAGRPSSIPLHPHNNRPHGLSVRRTASAAIGARLIARSRKRTAGQAPADDFPSLRLLSPADCGFAQKDGGFPPTPARP